jgi:hypothetical protein
MFRDVKIQRYQRHVMQSDPLGLLELLAPQTYIGCCLRSIKQAVPR